MYNFHFLLNLIVAYRYLCTERMILLRDLKFCWIQIWK